MSVSSKARSRPRTVTPGKTPKSAKPSKTAEELQTMLAERSGEAVTRIAVFGESGNWSATLLVNPTGNAERRARLRRLPASGSGSLI